MHPLRQSMLLDKLKSKSLWRVAIEDTNALCSVRSDVDVDEKERNWVAVHCLGVFELFLVVYT
jgi:hypothetical protein